MNDSKTVHSIKTTDLTLSAKISALEILKYVCLKETHQKIFEYQNKVWKTG